jgi:hypothetical protein
MPVQQISPAPLESLPLLGAQGAQTGPFAGQLGSEERADAPTQLLGVNWGLEVHPYFTP